MNIIKIKNNLKQLDPSVKLLTKLIISSIIYHLTISLFAAFEFELIPDVNAVISGKLLYHPGADASYFSSFQCLILIWNGILSFLISRNVIYKKTYFLYFIWFYLFIDDFFLIHDFIDSIIPEIFYWLILLISFIIFLIFKVSSLNIKSRKFLNKNLLFFSGLTFFALGVDVFSKYVVFTLPNLGYLKAAFIYFEELGELATVSLAFIYLFNKLLTEEKIINKEKSFSNAD